MKFKSILATVLAAAAVFSSCSKDDNGATAPANGAKATMDLKINFPKVMGTRAADGNASAQDVAITNVTVFIFEADGSHATNSPATFAAGDFDDQGSNVYALKETKRIETTAGTKNIYVGVNLPASISGVTNESELLGEISTADLFSANDVAMLSVATSKNLVAQEENTTPTANTVSVEVKRLVAKVAVTAGTDASYTPAAGYTIAPNQFAVGTQATYFYPVQRVAGGKLVTPMKYSSDVTALKAINANGTAAKDLADFYYVPEHSTSAANLRGEATYAVVRGELTFTNYAKIVADVVDLTTPATGHTGDIYVVRKGIEAYFCQTAADQAEVAAAKGLGAEKFTYSPAADGKFYTFYHVFINANAADKLAVYRNQFINVVVTGVKGLGLPGDPTNPDQPKTPIDNGDEPAVETVAYLEVSVDVAEWDYASVDTVLE